MPARRDCCCCPVVGAQGWPAAPEPGRACCFRRSAGCWVQLREPFRTVGLFYSGAARRRCRRRRGTSAGAVWVLARDRIRNRAIVPEKFDQLMSAGRKEVFGSTTCCIAGRLPVKDQFTAAAI